MSLTLGIIASSRGNIVPPLDTYGGAAAAYSTRLLSSAYGGAAVRVRRSFDNAEQDIGFSGGAIDETALMNFVGYQNLFQRSEEFNDVAWRKVTVSINSNSTIAPNGTLTADKVIVNNGIASISSEVRPETIVSITSGQTYTWSIYAKASEWSFIRLTPWSNDDPSTIFNLSNGTVSSQQGPSHTASITSIGDGWYRCSVTRVAPTSSALFRVVPFQSETVGGTGDGTSGVFIWGAQLNVGTTAQPYQVTTSAARSGDGFVTKWYTQDSNGENLLLQSQTFETANWNKFNSSIVADNTTAPDGTLTADKLNETAVTGQHGCVQVYTIPSANIYTFSIYVKAAERSTVNIVVYFNGGATDNFSARFNLSTGVVTSTSTGGAGVLISSTIQSVGSGWYRCSIIGNTTMSGSHSIQLGLLDASLNTTYLGVVGSGVFIWGAQLSQSTWLQPYQVTTTTAILRRDASQSTAANQPRIVGGGVIERENGKAAIRFDGVDDRLDLASDITYTTTGNQYVSAVFTPAVAVTTSSGVYGILNGTATVDTRIFYSLGPLTGLLTNERVSYLKLNGGQVLGYGQTISDLSPTPKLQSISFDPPSLFNIFQNSIQQQFVQTDNGPLSASQYPSTFGRIGASSTGSIPFFGDMQEIILYGTSRSANRGDIDRNIGAYYQTQWTGASSGLLDQFGGAAAAYSLRNLSSSYRGPLIRVRRSSDNAETDIGGTYNGDLDVASLLSFTGGQNLLLQSEDFSSGSWSKTNSSITANATIAPDGTLTADKYVETAVNGFHALYQDYSVPSISPMTLSFYAKAAERRYIGVAFYHLTSPFSTVNTIFDIVNGSVSFSTITASGVLISSSIQSVGNGWFRCSVTGNINATGASRFQINLRESETVNSYLGVAGSGVYIWGAQLNTGILQPYIPTTTAAINGANAFVTKWYTQDNNYQNLLLQSEAFEAINWTKLNSSVTTNATIAPNGTNTAERLTENTTSALHFVSYNNAGLAGLYTLSFYAKADSRSWCYVTTFDGSTDRGAYFNLSNGTIGSVDAGATALIQSVGNGWYRCIVTGSPAATFGASIQLAVANNQRSYLGDGASGIYIWGAQLNEGSVAQPYTATTTTASQRRDAIQATAANQPRIVNAGGVESEGNRPALFFDGAGDFFSMPNIEVNNLDYSAFHVSRNNSNTTRGFELSSANVGPYFGKANDGNLYVQYIGATDLYYSAAEPSTVLSLRSGFARAASANAYINNLQLSLSAPVSYTASDTGFNQIGKYSSSPTSNAEASELVLYIGDRLSSRTGIESNINSYYRIYWQGNGTALLDNFSGASAAYSLRNLSSAYTGPLIRVRRSNDNVERDIYGTFGGDLDIASLVAFVGANSGFVTTWYDQSGNAINATQTTAANQPRIVNAGVVETQNGKPAVYNLVGCGMSFSSISLTNFTILWVSVRDTTNANQSIMLSNSLATSTYIGDDVDNQGNPMAYSLGYIIALPRNNTSATNLETSYHLSYLNRRNSTEAVGEFNNSSNSYNNSVPSTTITINAIALYPTTSYNYVGKIQEIIVYSNDQSSSRTPISSNINNYYKIY